MLKTIIIVLILYILVGGSFYLNQKYDIIQKIKDRFSKPEQVTAQIQEADDDSSIILTHPEEFE